MKYKKNRFKKPYGFIDYYYIIDNKYPHGVLIFMGSFVQKEERGKGLFKLMIKELFELFPKGTEVQVAISNKILINSFKELGFVEVDSIEYWGKLDNTVNLKGFLK